MWSILFILVSCGIAAAQIVCDNTNPSARVDCHQEAGATEEKCQSKGCCWHPTQPGTPWCFRPQPKDGPRCSVSDISRGDCHPEPGASESTCVARGCCWMSSSASGASWCYFPSDYKGYNVGYIRETNFGHTADLSVAPSSVNLPFPKVLNNLKMDVYQETEKRLRIKIYDPYTNRYEVPLDTPKVLSKTSNPSYQYNINTTPYSGVKVTRSSSSSVIFDSTVSSMTYSDQYIEISVAVPTGFLYGLGEHTGSLLLQKNNGLKYSMWTRDQPPNEDHSVSMLNIYFREEREKSLLFYPSPTFCYNKLYLAEVYTEHGHRVVYLLTQKEVGLVDTMPVAVNYKTTGGILDFYVFLGPTPDQVIEQYTEVIGRPMLPPYWSFGFHLCRWGYGNTNDLRLIVDEMRKTNFPYDTQWVDIDYMDQYRDWTLDPKNFADLPALVDDLHSYGMHFIPIVDPGISTTPGYAPYDDGVNRGVFIKTSDNSSYIVGKVWPGSTVFPDFTHPDAGNYWYTHAKAFHDTVQYDGMWIDMNEPANFVAGSTSGCSSASSDNPPFIPPITGSSLSDKTLCPSAQQHISSHYNLHSMYGHFEAKVTYDTMKRIRGKRSLIISRSTFAGSGKYAGHWTGDNYSSWADMKYSIAGIINFNLFGIPMVGADICGFGGTVDVELCTRWMQLGSYYPFMRNHRDQQGDGQDPASIKFRSTLPAMKSAVEQRYRLLPYLYTLFRQSHVDGSPVIRPLFFQFPTDSKTYDNDEQFMWGDGLLISPVLTKGATTVQAYFPQGNWFDIETGAEIMGGVHVLDAPLNKINVHLRGGVIIPTQGHDVTTTKSRTKDFTLLVALSLTGEATGELFWDDGESFDTITSDQYNSISFQAGRARLTSQIVKEGFADKMTLDSIVMYGMHSRPSTVNFNGHQAAFVYNSTNKVLTIEHLHWSLLKPMTVTW